MPDSTAPLLDLATNRKIILTDTTRNRVFTLMCRIVDEADWLAYFAALSITSELDGKNQINTVDFETSRKLLAETVLIDASGYKVDGFEKLTDIPNWQTRIPLAHRLQLGSVLADVRVAKSDDDDFTIRAEGEVVLLDATWSAYTFTDEEYNERQAMQRFTSLKHVFATPSATQHRRYQRQASRSIVVGGSRTGRTIYSGAQELLCTLYDELIVTVEGYSLNGVALTAKQQIVDNMDLHHKFSAAQELFNPAVTTSAEVAAG